MIKSRKSGILCHITSLASNYGVGDLGPAAYEFVDFLHDAKQKVWQILPLTPTNPLTDNSPYSSPSAFAGNRYLISPELLLKDGFLDKKDVQKIPSFHRARVDYKKAVDFKEKLFKKLFQNFDVQDLQYQSFIEENRFWLDDYAQFMLLKKKFGRKFWIKWPKEFCTRDTSALERLSQNYEAELNEFKVIQFIFFKQWARLKNYCYQKGVEILGDIPIYVLLDSVDVWCHPHNFKLDKNFVPRFVSGAPPDAFSDRGQRWGNPVYDWQQMKNKNFDWWLKRIHFHLKLYDWIRIDHFRGFVNYWEIPYSETAAIKGKWVQAPIDDFLKALRACEAELPIIAEDLGEITDEVRAKINRIGFPGMKILQFAFDNDIQTNPYLPHNYDENCVVYTGTHDNNTTIGWFKSLGEWQRYNLLQYLGRAQNPYHGIKEENIHWALLRLALESKANWAIIPLQDVLGLDERARMNIPGVKKGNWVWQLSSDLLDDKITAKLAKTVQSCQRA